MYIYNITQTFNNNKNHHSKSNPTAILCSVSASYNKCCLKWTDRQVYAKEWGTYLHASALYKATANPDQQVRRVHHLPGLSAAGVEGWGPR